MEKMYNKLPKNIREVLRHRPLTGLMHGSAHIESCQMTNLILYHKGAYMFSLQPAISILFYFFGPPC
jgi:hypothetical protein